MTARKKVVLYPRVSSPKQLSNDSLPTQRREMERFADREGFEVARIFEDGGKSAKTTNRPALQDMLRWISEHPGEIYAVLVFDFKRAARNVEDHLSIRATLTKQRVRLISITQPVTDDPYGRFMEVIHAGVAELDNSVRGERSKLGMVSATERGRWCHQAPVGYVNCGRNAVPSLSPDLKRADVVKETFTHVASGEATLSVYYELVERGFGTRRGGVIGRQTFYSILRNPAYKGQLVTKLGISDGDWDPLVEPDTWEQVQAVLSQTRRCSASAETRKKSGKRPYRRIREGFELWGSLKCAVCGRRITGGVTKRYAYMNCPEGHVRGRAEVLNSRFLQWLASVRPNEVFLRRLETAIRRELDAAQRSLSHRRAEQQRAAAKIRAKLQNLNLALADGTMDRDAYRETYSGLKAELQAREHAGVEDELEQLDVDAMFHFAKRLLSQPERWWADASPEDKIRLQHALFPDGLLINPALQFSTDPNSHDSMTYLMFAGGSDDMASPTGPDRLQTPIDRDFRFACPRWPLYTPEGRPAPETLVRHSIVPLQRPSAQPVVTCGRLEALFSRHFSDTAPHVGHFFANRTALPVPRVSLPAPAAPRSAATCRRTAAGLDVLPPAGASRSQ